MDTKNKQYFIYICCVLLLGIAVYNFWYTEWKYLLPTPTPNGYSPKQVGEQLNLHTLLPINDQQPVFLHFFSIDCPCSKFNIQHFNQLVEKYQGKVQFYAVLFAEDTVGLAQSFEKKLNVRVPLIVHNGTKIAEQCGVYATPQAALLTANGTLYYRGNYNTSRYCSNKETEFARMAVEALLRGSAPPQFGELATRAYGCELPDNYYENLSIKN